MSKRYLNWKNQIIDLEKILGKGKFGTVYECWHNENPAMKLAAKIISLEKHKVDQDQYNTWTKYAESDFRILNSIQQSGTNPFIIKMQYFDFFAYNEKDELSQFLREHQNQIIIYELCDKTLEDLLNKHKLFPEQIAIQILKNLLLGYRDLQNNQIIHRDLKPTNILLKDNIIKISDFGFARLIGEERSNLSYVGTDLFCAPEILFQMPQGQKDKIRNNIKIKLILIAKCDIWSLGVIFQMMLFGYHPFQYVNNQPHNLTEDSIIFALRNQPISQMPLYNYQVSKYSIDILRRMLDREESTRIDQNALEILVNQYFPNILPGAIGTLSYPSKESMVPEANVEISMAQSKIMETTKHDQISISLWNINLAQYWYTMLERMTTARQKTSFFGKKIYENLEISMKKCFLFALKQIAKTFSSKSFLFQDISGNQEISPKFTQFIQIAIKLNLIKNTQDLLEITEEFTPIFRETYFALVRKFVEGLKSMIQEIEGAYEISDLDELIFQRLLIDSFLKKDLVFSNSPPQFQITPDYFDKYFAEFQLVNKPFMLQNVKDLINKVKI